MSQQISSVYFQVTWLRRSDYHILSVGMVTYTSDERFSAVRGEVPTAAGGAGGADGESGGPEDWMLQIRGVAESDAGEYECHVNTQPPTVSINVTLRVLGRSRFLRDCLLFRIT